MRFPRPIAWLSPLVVCAALTAGCVSYLPQRVELNSDAANVEILSDPPNPEVYESAGDVTAQVVGREISDAFRQACNELRNQAAAKGATFVALGEVNSRASWDLSGRTIVSVSGVAYRAK